VRHLTGVVLLAAGGATLASGCGVTDGAEATLRRFALHLARLRPLLAHGARVPRRPSPSRALATDLPRGRFQPAVPRPSR